MVIIFELVLLFQGRFSTNIARKETLVKFKIYAIYEVTCEFKCMGTGFVFNLTISEVDGTYKGVTTTTAINYFRFCWKIKL